MSDRDLPEKRNPSADSSFGFVSNAWHGLSRPLRILLVTTVLCLGAGAAFIGVRKVSEPYATLFSALPEADAAAVVAKLKELKVPHRVVEGGRIEVPEERVHEIRLEMAGAGLPRGGAVGFENFDKMKLGATEFEQKVMFRRALEGELARTIGSVQAVEAARVHLVMPERSVFANRREPASASVVVKLRQGRELGNPEIGAIVHLVASAVPGLSQDRVTLATTEGALLKRPKSATEGGAETGLADDQLAEVRALEASLEERARTMLERVVGAGHVDVRVAADMDFSRVEHTEDHFKPRDPILRSEELMVEKTGAAENTVAGVPGAESNLPTGDAPEEGDAPAGAAGVLRRQHTRNFEVDRVTERRVRQAGVVKRLTVAVVVDGVSTTDESGAVTVQARDEAELEKLEALVRSAVGADDNRQDVVTLQSMSFVSAPVADGELLAPVAATPLEKAKPYLPFVAAGGVFLALVTATMLTRRRRSTVTAVELLPSGELKRENELLSEDAPLLLNAREEALRRASEDPATAALVVRHWLGMGSAAEDGSSRAA
jgi:flagellar M-ring protein FliF